MKKETSIQKTVYDEDNNVVELCLIKVVTPHGSGASVVLPKGLIGKKVKVEYKKGEKY